MKLQQELKKIASELKNNEATLVSKEIRPIELLKKAAFVKIKTWDSFLPKKR